MSGTFACMGRVVNKQDCALQCSFVHFLQLTLWSIKLPNAAEVSFEFARVNRKFRLAFWSTFAFMC